MVPQKFTYKNSPETLADNLLKSAGRHIVLILQFAISINAF